MPWMDSRSTRLSGACQALIWGSPGARRRVWPQPSGGRAARWTGGAMAGDSGPAAGWPAAPWTGGAPAGGTMDRRRASRRNSGPATRWPAAQWTGGAPAGGTVDRRWDGRRHTGPAARQPAAQWTGGAPGGGTVDRQRDGRRQWTGGGWPAARWTGGRQPGGPGTTTAAPGDAAEVHRQGNVCAGAHPVHHLADGDVRGWTRAHPRALNALPGPTGGTCRGTAR